MEGERKYGGFSLGNLENKLPPSYKPSPPLSAIDRFLLGQQQNQNKQTLDLVLPSPNPRNGTTTSFESSSFGFSWPTIRSDDHHHMMNLRLPVDPFFDDENCSWMYDHDASLLNSNLSIKNQETRTISGKKKVINNSSTLIKGQWTEEEDRKLIKLVKQYGERKWAQIADKLIGRAGKQCRERWHNHLRPDIKKDGWSEDEERMLIEAHQIVGNRWAEIAKRIPGRTENSIKNHFNATKRRQNSRRKNKARDNAKEGVKPQTTILQDYIYKSNTGILLTSIDTNDVSTTNTTIDQMSLDQSESVTDDSPPLIPHASYDDELLFIQNFFAPNTNNIHDTYDQPSIDNNNISSPSLNELNSTDRTSINNKCHLYSDTYLSYLLNGENNTNGSTTTSTSTRNCYSSSYSNDCYCYNNMGARDEYTNLDLVQDQHQKEMDLIEMVSQGSTNNY